MNPEPTSPVAASAPSTGRAPSPLGHWVRKRRQGMGMTVARLAQAVGCSKGHLSAIETGRHHRPGDDLLRRLETALACEPGLLLGMAYISDTPAPVRRELSLLRDRHRDAGRLAELLGGLGGLGGPGSPPSRGDDLGGGEAPSATDAGDGLTWPTGRTALDQAHNSGELRRLINRLSPPDPREQLSGHGAGPQAGPEVGPDGGNGLGDDASERSVSAKLLEARLLETGSLEAGLLDAGMAVALLAALPREVPLINRVAAGYPTEFTDLGYPARVADEYVRCPDIADADAFAARVIGDSMLPDYREGDIVIFSPARDVRPGSDCFARIEPDHESTFKRVFFERDADGEELIRLQPLNPAYPPRTLPREHVAGLYAAVTVMRRIG